MEVHLIKMAGDKKGWLKMRRLIDRTRFAMLSKEERQISVEKTDSSLVIN